MARIRTIKPAFFTSEDVSAVSIPARLLFIGLWTEADREGRLEYRPRQLKARLFPMDADLDVAPLLEELRAVGLVRSYASDGGRYIAIPAWHKHQKVHPKEPESFLPAPPPGDKAVEKHGEPWKNTAGRVFPGSIPSSPGEGKGREGKGTTTDVVGPRHFDRAHRGHVNGFCEWVCLPDFLVARFVNKGGGDESAVEAWAQGVRAAWPAGRPIGDSLKFWEARWAESHPDPSERPSKDAEADALHAAQMRRIEEGRRRRAELDAPREAV